MNRIATMDIGEVMNTRCTWSVTLHYRGQRITSFTGLKDEVGTLIQKAHAYAINAGYTNTKQNWLPKL